jgi:hypothetical protein
MVDGQVNDHDDEDIDYDDYVDDDVDDEDNNPDYNERHQLIRFKNESIPTQKSSLVKPYPKEAKNTAHHLRNLVIYENLTHNENVGLFNNLVRSNNKKTRLDRIVGILFLSF